MTPLTSDRLLRLPTEGNERSGPALVARGATVILPPSSFARRSGGRLERLADLGHVAVIGAAAAADDGQLRQHGPELAVLRAELGRVARVQVRALVELLVAALRGVGAQA